MRKKMPCFECGKPSVCDHHVIPKSFGGTKTVPLCGDCDHKIHGNRGRLTLDFFLQRKREQGIFLGGVPPVGYRIDEKHKLVKDEEEWGIIDQVVSLRKKGWATDEIAEEMNERGISFRSLPVGRNRIKLMSKKFCTDVDVPNRSSPFGYKTRHGNMVPIQKEQETIEIASDLYRQKWKIEAIAVELNSRGLSRRGKSWSQGSLYSILFNKGVTAREYRSMNKMQMPYGYRITKTKVWESDPEEQRIVKTILDLYDGKIDDHSFFRDDKRLMKKWRKEGVPKRVIAFYLNEELEILHRGERWTQEKVSNVIKYFTSKEDRMKRASIAYGYRYEGKKVVPDREEQKNLCRLARLRRSGYGWSRLTKALPSLGIRNRAGNFWDQKTLKVIMCRNINIRHPALEM